MFVTLEFNRFYRESAIISIPLFFLISRYTNSRLQLGYWVVPVHLLSLNTLQIVSQEKRQNSCSSSKSVSYWEFCTSYKWRKWYIHVGFPFSPQFLHFQSIWLSHSSLHPLKSWRTRSIKEKRTQAKITGSDVSSTSLCDKSCKITFLQTNLSRCNTDHYASILRFWGETVLLKAFPIPSSSLMELK